ncbi:hypothetical protein [Thiomonas sp.]
MAPDFPLIRRTLVRWLRHSLILVFRHPLGFSGLLTAQMLLSYAPWGPDLMPAAYPFLYVLGIVMASRSDDQSWRQVQWRGALLAAGVLSGVTVTALAVLAALAELPGMPGVPGLGLNQASALQPALLMVFWAPIGLLFAPAVTFIALPARRIWKACWILYDLRIPLALPPEHQGVDLTTIRWAVRFLSASAMAIIIVLALGAPLGLVAGIGLACSALGPALAYLVYREIFQGRKENLPQTEKAVQPGANERLAEA